MRMTRVLKDPLREARVVHARSIEALAGVFFLLLAVIGRLFYLQVLSHEHFQMLSRDNRVKIVPVPPTRGLIYDRNGVLLAENQVSFSLEIVPEQVGNLNETLDELSRLIEVSPADRQRFLRLVRQHRGFEAVPLRFHLSEEEVARFSVNRLRFPAVDIQARLSRYYPLGELATHAVGYVGRINEWEVQHLDSANYAGSSHVGKVGVEHYHEDLLHGKVGYEQVETNAQGRALRVLERTPPVSGDDLYLTLDVRLQAAAEAALGEFNGAVVALEPRTGSILALVSKPSYDPNPFVNGIDVKSYRELQTNHNRPLYNRAMRGQYPPGSTIKPFVTLAGVEHGLVSGKRGVYCPGWYRLSGEEHKYRCWKHTGHGAVDMNRAIVESCDVFFYDLAGNLGIDRLSNYLSRFGFGSKTGVDISGELGGLLPTRDWKRLARNQSWYPGETIITGIGQGFLNATPLQLAYATATLANRGQPVRPHILYAVAQPATKVLQVHQPQLQEPLSIDNAEYWDKVTSAMMDVVHSSSGTAKRIVAGLNYHIAGKTGTSQVFGLGQKEKYVKENIPLELRDHALFIAFAPVEAPRIAIAVIAENAGSGGAMAAPIARQILDAYLKEKIE
ncbi:Peptidoglycan D,D-transpeptidase MrdA [Gammaproteobacteria bacterium]